MKLSELLKELDRIHAERSTRPLTLKTGKAVDPELDAALCLKLLSAARYNQETVEGVR